jgi:hypothetical protein
MDWLLTLVMAGGAVVAGRLLWDRRRSASTHAEELRGVRALADQDVTLFGEELHRLDAAVSRLDQDGKVDFQRALDAYESAQREVPRMASVDSISTVADTLATGRYALACVRARLADQPLPELRRPCFFNPQHGPSVRDVLYTTATRGTRTVPVCAQDAARLAAGERPEILKVKIGSVMVPYWEAGAAYLPYGQGYFVGGGLAGAATLGWAFEAQAAGETGGGGYVHGSHDVGGFDGGGFDGGGGGDGGS